MIEDKMFDSIYNFRCSTGGGNLRSAAAFTVIEMITVLFIIGLLMGILVPTIGSVSTAIARSRSLATIHQIETGIHAYYQDFEEYPLDDNEPKFDGAQNLVYYLTFYEGEGMDGHKGFGGRREKDGTYYGKICGPYAGTEKLDTKGSGNPVFVDSFDNTIEYYRYDNGYSGPTNYYAIKPADEGGGYFRTDFILCTPGPNGQWDAYRNDRTTDDITNFLQE